jgi:hypothetical protein
MERRKRKGPRAVAAARKAKIVACGKPTHSLTATVTLDANAFAQAWVARRYRAQARWAAVIADAAGLGERP